MYEIDWQPIPENSSALFREFLLLMEQDVYDAIMVKSETTVVVVPVK